jgi:hypothetical protein
MNKKVQKFCFTLNNYTEDEYRKIREYMVSKCVYGIVGREIGELGTPHLQGYFNLGRDGRKSFATLKKEIGSRAHIEQARGSDEQNRTYCSKTGDFVEHGELQSSGKRNDLNDVAEAITKGGSVEDVALSHPSTYIKFHRGIEALHSVVASRRTRSFKTEVSVLVGAPGSGKSRYASAKSASLGSTYYKPRGEWWDGYNGQISVVIDDFYGWLKYDDLLKITDRYPYQVPIKGGYRQFTSKYIFITSNVEIDKWYKFEGYDTTALRRRIEHYHINEIPDGNIYNEDGIAILDIYDMQELSNIVQTDGDFPLE